MEREEKFPTTQLEAVERLSELHHVFLTEKFTRSVLQLFPGAVDPSFDHVVNHQGFKGLSVPGMEDGDKVWGADAADLADAVAKSLGMEGNPMRGRGSRLRFACEYSIDKLKELPSGPLVEEGAGKSGPAQTD